MIISLIAAVSKNNVIGKDNKLPWHLPEDLKHFKELTFGHAIIMGRKTFESIGRPLPRRTNIVVTRNKNYEHEGVKVVHSIEAAIQAAKDSNENEVFIIGGAEVYKQALSFANKIYLTRIKANYEGDAYFPDLGPEWKEVDSKDHGEYVFKSLSKSY